MTLIDSIACPDTDRAAKLWRTATGYTVSFGWIACGSYDGSEEFRLSFNKGSRDYKREGTARRAMARWLGEAR